MTEHEFKRYVTKVLGDMVVIVDTREQKNQHILDYFKTEGIPYVHRKLDTADYSFELPNYSELGLDEQFLVEKKNSLDEIAGNFSKDRARFEREFERSKSHKSIHLVIENATFKKLRNQSYRSQLHPNSLMAGLMTWTIRYDCPTWFTTKEESGWLIHNILKYELIEFLKNKNKED